MEYNFIGVLGYGYIKNQNTKFQPPFRLPVKWKTILGVGNRYFSQKSCENTKIKFSSNFKMASQIYQGK